MAWIDRFVMTYAYVFCYLIANEITSVLENNIVTLYCIDRKRLLVLFAWDIHAQKIRRSYSQLLFSLTQLSYRLQVT